MDLVVDEVGELQDVDVADRDRVVVDLAGPAVVQSGLAVGPDEARTVGRVGVQVLEDLADGRMASGVSDLVPVGTVECRRGHPDSRVGPRPRLGLLRQVAGLAVSVFDSPSPNARRTRGATQHLAHVHPARHAEGVQDDVYGGAVGQIRHVLDRQDLGDDALVPVAPGELVAL